MRALLISDIHGNIDALRALEAPWGSRLQEFERIICLGDLVDYGPSPGDVIDWTRSHATNVVRGNHDHAVATGESCRSAPAFLEASVLTRLRLQETLTANQVDYLSALPYTDTVTDIGLHGSRHCISFTPVQAIRSTRTCRRNGLPRNGRLGSRT